MRSRRTEGEDWEGRMPVEKCQMGQAEHLTVLLKEYRRNDEVGSMRLEPFPQSLFLSGWAPLYLS